jgi:hypothetical protein
MLHGARNKSASRVTKRQLGLKSVENVTGGLRHRSPNESCYAILRTLTHVTPNELSP